MAAAKTKKWSQHVTETSDAMDVAKNTFAGSDPKKIAETLEHDAESSKRRKSSPYRSAMSMLTFYINRAGTNLSAKQRKVLEDAKELLRSEFGPGKTSAKPKPRTPVPRKKTGAKKAPARTATAKKSPRRKRAAG